MNNLFVICFKKISNLCINNIDWDKNVVYIKI